jgi:hypothetical protein
MPIHPGNSGRRERKYDGKCTETSPCRACYTQYRAGHRKQVILGATYTIFGVVWSLDPPWKVNELLASIISWGKRVNPDVVVHFYKMRLFVRTDDGATSVCLANKGTAKAR